MKRRALLIGGLSVGALAGALGWRLGIVTEQQAIVDVLHKRLDYLRLDESGLRRFADDLVRHRSIPGVRLRLLAAAGPLYRSFRLGNDPIAKRVRHVEERIVTAYLLSSDYFRSGQNEARSVQYLGFYDPFQACNNPFARPVTLA